jgi:hypothetical protein
LPVDQVLDEASALLETLDMDDDSEKFAEAMTNYQRLVLKKSADEFMNRVFPTLSPGVKELRAELVSDIESLLQQCRSCASWGERGEYKLPSWLEYVEESMIPYTSIPKLKMIKFNLEELLRRHNEQGGN